MPDDNSNGPTPTLQPSPTPSERSSTGGFTVSMSGTRIKIPATLLIVILAALGVGGASAGGNLLATQATQPSSATVQAEFDAIKDLLQEQIDETRKLRIALETSSRRDNLRKLEHEEMDGDIERIKARDQARDKLLGLDDQLRGFPLVED